MNHSVHCLYHHCIQLYALFIWNSLIGSMSFLLPLQTLIFPFMHLWIKCTGVQCTTTCYQYTWCTILLESYACCYCLEICSLSYHKWYKIFLLKSTNVGMAGWMYWLKKSSQQETVSLADKVHKQGVCSGIAQHSYILYNHPYSIDNKLRAN